MRGSDPDATVYWLARMIDAGEDPKFIARRIMIHASEDVGNADPQALLIAHAAFKSAEVIGYPECVLTSRRLRSMFVWRLSPMRVRLRSMRRWPISILVGFARCLVICAIAIARAAMITVCISIHMIIPKAGRSALFARGTGARRVLAACWPRLGRMARRAKRTRPQRECTEVAADNFVPRCCSWHVRSPLGYHGNRLYFDSFGRLV